jgi:hypothetical protein
MIFTPGAPNRRADWTALFMARRKATRLSSWAAVASATNCAFLANLVDLGTFSADDDAGARGSNDDAELIGFALKLDAGDAGVVQSLLEVPTDLEVFVELIRIRPRREPPRFPGLDVPTAISRS